MGRIYRRRLVVAVAIAQLLLGGSALAKQVWSFTPERGFVDDVMAFDSSGSRFAYIHTDSAQILDIVVLDTNALKEQIKIKIADPRRVPKSLVFSPDAKQLLFVWMDGQSGKHGAMLLDVDSGKLRKEVGSAQFAKVTLWSGQQVLVLGDINNDARGNQKLTLRTYRASDFKRLKVARLHVRADGTLKKPPLRLSYWERAHLTLVGMKRGTYDRKRDIRLPDEAMRYDVLTRKILWTHVPQKLVPWTTAVNMRPNHPEQYRFLQVSDDLKTLYFVDRANGLHEVTTPVRWKLYEPKSLQQKESWDGSKLYFSMTVDPANPEAIARKKLDQERCDIYRLGNGATAQPLGQVLTGKRKFSWVVSNQHFAYLRKLKGFGRGGKTIEIHPVGK